MTSKQAPRAPEIEEHPDHPGWYWWGGWKKPDSFAAQVGLMLFKQGDEPGTGIVRMFPEERHLNPGGSVHGGCVMTFIDMAMFAGGFAAGMERAHYVTLDCHTRFMDRARAGKPLDCLVRIERATPGGIVFLSGIVTQEGRPCYSYNGTAKKVRDPRKKADDER
ncbi:PaaI family thioesterase [Sphingomicrobium astaxanthinifaciens]|uniref:PaaI family thioesterase n=1 Tax=Sphingomicrobium astaxanthinifaciens TaxID=1227949 RepID=UPI001FCAA8E1|nr:PaaI family thioesterase [Sphingomicrobium astaxanthinifaciens]MCJ7421667.1 PaaI family thioesterase [Sphingomicrobium astaxanthinifaciens]